MSTIKQLVKDGTIKRADALKISLADIYVEPGFNERTDGDALEAHIEGIATFLLAGGQVPALEVRPRADGGVWLVDGHCRREAYARAIARGAAIEWINVTHFSGNDADRVARIVSSNNGMPLTPLETSRVYKRLQGFGMTTAAIAEKVGRTRAHVEQMLVLALANTDVQGMVSDGVVNAAVAVGAVRKHGEQAGAFLAQQAEKAKAAGKAKITAGTINGKPLPRKLVDNIEGTMKCLRATLPRESHELLATIDLNNATLIPVPGAVLLQLIELAADAEDTRKDQLAKAQAKAVKAAQLEMEA